MKLEATFGLKISIWKIDKFFANYETWILILKFLSICILKALFFAGHVSISHFFCVRVYYLISMHYSSTVESIYFKCRFLRGFVDFFIDSLTLEIYYNRSHHQEVMLNPSIHKNPEASATTFRAPLSMLLISLFTF